MAQAWHFEIRDVERIGRHYVPTLRLWRQRLLANSGGAKDLGFDDVLLRTWEFYFAYCEAAFAEGLVDDLQFVVCRAGSSSARLLLSPQRSEASCRRILRKLSVTSPSRNPHLFMAARFSITSLSTKNIQSLNRT